ncbi:MAG: nitroreductase family protein [Rhodospirillaceae bacterium]
MLDLKLHLNNRYGEECSLGQNVEVTDQVIALLSRRSIRLYEEKEVSKELIEVLLACAQSAPTKSNLQQYSIIVIDDPAIRKALSPWCPRTKTLETVPGLVVFCADLRRNRKIGEFTGKQNNNDNMDSLLNATVDGALALGYFVAAAEAAGLGCAPLSSLRDFMHGVSKILNLPDGVFPIAGVMFGWPATEGYVNQRLPQDVVVHYNSYDDSNLEERVSHYDQIRHAAHAVPPARQQKTDRYGTADPYFWSEHISRQLSVPERAEFRAYLQEHGFALR